jgi:hypothetical protein
MSAVEKTGHSFNPSPSFLGGGDAILSVDFYETEDGRMA